MKLFPLQGLITFLQEVRLEARRVNWPTRKEVLQNALLVVGITLVTALFLGGVDFLFVQLLEKVISIR
ncbi:MAG: preprotein translocase subunit SecE [bacterium]|nr:preprotein translocase subunit SecE [bacterium]